MKLNDNSKSKIILAMNVFYLWSSIFLLSLFILILNIYILNELFNFQYTAYNPNSFCQKLNKFKYLILYLQFLISFACIPVVPQSLLIFILNIAVILYFRFYVFISTQRIFDPLLIRRDLNKYKYRHLAIFLISCISIIWALVEVIVLAYTNV